MKIRVKSFLTLKKVMGDQDSMEMEVDSITLKGLLEELSVRFGQDFKNMIIDHENRPGRDNIQILINGRYYIIGAFQIGWIQN